MSLFFSGGYGGYEDMDLFWTPRHHEEFWRTEINCWQFALDCWFLTVLSMAVIVGVAWWGVSNTDIEDFVDRMWFERGQGLYTIDG